MQCSSYLDVLDDLFWVFDETGSLREWNEAVVEVTGYDETTLATTSLAGFFADEDAERIDAAVERAVETGEARVETTLVTAGGERVPSELCVHRVTEDGDTRLACVGVGLADSERERLRSHERVLREMYEVIADRQLAFAQQVEALLALGRAELGTAFGTLSRIEGEEYRFEIVDTDADDVQAGDVVPVSATNCEIAATTRETLVLGDVARDAPEETDRAGYTDWGISCYIGAPVIADDEVYGTFCFYDTDPREGQFSEWEVTLVDLMSRWVSYELQQTRARDRLKRQNEKLEEFASLVSHDLRNPLNVVEGSLERAEQTGDLEQLTPAREALDRMNALIDDLLRLSRSGAVIDETETVDLSTLSRECWGVVATNDATLAVTAERTVEGDRTRLQQLLENLFRNASEHGGDAVTVTVGDLPDGFFVEDDGRGIPDADRDRVLDSGFTTSETGTGFGLAIVAEIAEAHGWEVRVTESDAGGARFEFGGLTG